MWPCASISQCYKPKQSWPINSTGDSAWGPWQLEVQKLSPKWIRSRGHREVVLSYFSGGDKFSDASQNEVVAHIQGGFQDVYRCFHAPEMGGTCH